MISSWTPDIESDEIGMKYRCAFQELSFKRTKMSSMEDGIRPQRSKCYQQQQEQQVHQRAAAEEAAAAALQQPRCSSVAASAL